MALYAVLYSLEAVIEESGILLSCIPRASRHTGGFVVGKPYGVHIMLKSLAIVTRIYLRKMKQRQREHKVCSRAK